MTIQTSGQISLADLQIEFGGNDPISLSEYYRSGSLVKADAPVGSASFQTFPLTTGSLVPIPTGGTIQLSHFYGARSVIIGSVGSIILAPTDNDTTSDYVDVPLPAGVDLIRIFLVGAGGGGGGQDGPLGGQGGGGSTLSGTINTAWAGPTNVPRTLRFFIGRRGQPGPSGTGDSWNRPAPPGGHGYGMFSIRTLDATWSTWLNTYGVTHENLSPTTANARATSRSLYFPNSGTYLFEFQADNIISIAVDGVNVADTNGLNDQGTNWDETYKLASPLTRTVSLTAGHHKVKFTFSNTGVIGAYGVRIVNNTTGGVFWTTRDEYATYKAYPAGGASGYAGGYGASGYGGSGGSATMLSIISGSGAEYFVALAGGGGGGGGAGTSGEPANVSLNGNWANQGISKTQYSPPRVAGDGGEYTSRKNNGANDVVNPYAADGGGGGGGGGGIVNNRQYVKPVNSQYSYSGFGGRTRRGQIISSDAHADGGESGKSAITSAATLYGDVQHNVTTNRIPINPTNPVGLPPAILAQLNSFGMGGEAASFGWNGAAYVDWGYVGATVTAPTVIRSPLRLSIIPYAVSASIAPGSPLNYSAAYVSGDKSFTLDAFGGGGDPGSEYTYTWTNVTGGATFSSPTSYRTIVTMAGAGAGAVRCTVSDGVSQATADWGWGIVADPVPTEPVINTCFPAGSLVLMGDGTEQLIETIKAGDLVMGVNGPELVLEMEMPVLGPRKMYSFADGHSWSEEHLHWTRDITGAQWWWTGNLDTWLDEVAGGYVVGLKDNSTMRTGDGFEYAHLDGWKNNDLIISSMPADTQLYLPVTGGGPIIVNGYLVTGGTNEFKFNYKAIDWDKSRISILALI